MKLILEVCAKTYHARYLSFLCISSFAFLLGNHSTSYLENLNSWYLCPYGLGFSDLNIPHFSLINF